MTFEVKLKDKGRGLGNTLAVNVRVGWGNAPTWVRRLQPFVGESTKPWYPPAFIFGIDAYLARLWARFGVSCLVCSIIFW